MHLRGAEGQVVLWSSFLPVWVPISVSHWHLCPSGAGFGAHSSPSSKQYAWNRLCCLSPASPFNLGTCNGGWLKESKTASSKQSIIYSFTQRYIACKGKGKSNKGLHNYFPFLNAFPFFLSCNSISCNWLAGNQLFRKGSGNWTRRRTCTPAAIKCNCILGCISMSVAGRSRKVILPMGLAFVKLCLEYIYFWTSPVQGIYWHAKGESHEAGQRTGTRKVEAETGRTKFLQAGGKMAKGRH